MLVGELGAIGIYSLHLVFKYNALVYCCRAIFKYKIPHMRSHLLGGRSFFPIWPISIIRDFYLWACFSHIRSAFTGDLVKNIRKLIIYMDLKIYSIVPVTKIPIFLSLNNPKSEFVFTLSKCHPEFFESKPSHCA